MPADNRLELPGVIVECLPQYMFRVVLNTGKIVRAWLASPLRLKFIPILPGDKVLVEFSPFDLSRGRIVHRQDPSKTKPLIEREFP